MATEIERKFLVAGAAWQARASEPVLIRQGYISRDPDRIVRVRSMQSTGYLTIKTSSAGPRSGALSRSEFEYPIPFEEAAFLLDHVCLAPVIIKNRYRVIEPDGSKWEVDEFIVPNEGLVVAEIELDRSDDTFARPIWVGDEVTRDHRYSNSNVGTTHGLNKSIRHP